MFGVGILEGKSGRALVGGGDFLFPAKSTFLGLVYLIDYFLASLDRGDLEVLNI